MKGLDIRKAGGVKGFGYNRVVMGGNTSTWYGYTLLPNWSAMDGPGPLDNMDDGERDAMLATGNALLAVGENHMLRYRADLSY
jgi:hypothetical protein